MHTLQSSQGLLDHNVDLASFSRTGQVHVDQSCRILFASPFGEGEHNNRQQVLFLQKPEEMDVKILVHSDHPICAPVTAASSTGWRAATARWCSPGPATSSNSLNRWKPCSFPLLVLFAPNCFASFFVSTPFLAKIGVNQTQRTLGPGSFQSCQRSCECHVQHTNSVRAVRVVEASKSRRCPSFSFSCIKLKNTAK